MLFTWRWEARHPKSWRPHIFTNIYVQGIRQKDDFRFRSLWHEAERFQIWSVSGENCSAVRIFVFESRKYNPPLFRDIIWIHNHLNVLSWLSWWRSGQNSKPLLQGPRVQTPYWGGYEFVANSEGELIINCKLWSVVPFFSLNKQGSKTLKDKF